MRYALGLVLLLSVAACARAREPAPCAEADAGRPVDPALLAFLSRARSAHHLADQAEATADLERAAKALADVVDGPLPGVASDPAPEVREVLADTLARQANLLSQRGDDARASELVERGLGLVPTPTYFRGHLFEVRGLLEERRSARLKERGDLDGSAAARARALDALDTAMKIQAEVIAREKPTPR